MKDKVIIASIIILIVIDLVYFVTKNGSTTGSATGKPSPNVPSATNVQTPSLDSVNTLPSTGRPFIDASKVHYEDDGGSRGSRD